jgi:hypothetical protein
MEPFRVFATDRGPRRNTLTPWRYIPNDTPNTIPTACAECVKRIEHYAATLPGYDRAVLHCPHAGVMFARARHGLSLVF